MSELAAWDSFYVIVGSAAAALIGLQFVVMTLIAERPPLRAAEAGAAFATPTIVHFGTALLYALFGNRSSSPHAAEVPNTHSFDSLIATPTCQGPKVEKIQDSETPPDLLVPGRRHLGMPIGRRTGARRRREAAKRLVVD
jgi:hypothetical protein